MQYCSDCRSVEQGTITHYPDGYTKHDYLVLGVKEILKYKKHPSDFKQDEILEWGKDSTAIEICSQCQSEDDTMINVNEDYDQDR